MISKMYASVINAQQNQNKAQASFGSMRINGKGIDPFEELRYLTAAAKTKFTTKDNDVFVSSGVPQKFPSVKFETKDGKIVQIAKDYQDVENNHFENQLATAYDSFVKNVQGSDLHVNVA